MPTYGEFGVASAENFASPGIPARFSLPTHPNMNLQFTRGIFQFSSSVFCNNVLDKHYAPI